MKYYNIMIDGKNFFDQPVKNNKIMYENIRKICTGKDMIIQLVAYYIMLISEIIIK